MLHTLCKAPVERFLNLFNQDFWSKLMSSARQLINTVHVDMLIVPLRDEEE